MRVLVCSGRRLLLLVALVLGLLTGSGRALAAAAESSLIGPQPPKQGGIVVNLPARRLYWYQDGLLARSFPVGAGTAENPTPVGAHRILLKAIDPYWQPPWGGPVIPPGPDNALGTRWMEFKPTFGIHGTIYPESVGFLTSFGCVRMLNADVEWLYDRVPVGTAVTVTYEPVQIEVDRAGRRYLAVYSDPYRRGGASVAQVLAAAGLELDRVVVNGAGHYLLESKVAVNGLPISSTLYQGKPYVQARSFAKQIGAYLHWDSLSASVFLDGKGLPTIIRGETGYVDAGAAAAAMDMEYAWNAQTGEAEFWGLPIYAEGKLLSRQGKLVDGVPYAPVRAVAEAVGAQVLWDDATQTVLLNGESIPYLLLSSGTSYAEATLLGQRLGLTAQYLDGTVWFD